MPNFQTLCGCNFYCLVFFGQNWGQKFRKPEINCVKLWSLLCFWGKFLVEWIFQHTFPNIYENWIIFQLLAITVPILIIFEKIFLVKFLIIFLVMLLLIFKSLFEVVAWKCQIVKIWSFLEEQDVVALFCFFNFLETDYYFLNHDLQHFAKYVPHFTELVQNLNILCKKFCVNKRSWDGPHRTHFLPIWQMELQGVC